LSETPIRIALGVEYDGSQFNGWQLQAHAPSVQETLENALSRVAAQPVRVVCAGRTDTGVHALGQVVHFDTTAERSVRAWVLGANVNSPRSVAVLWARRVPDAFHARFAARARHYRYVILNRWVRPAILDGRVTWERHPLEEAAMAEATRFLLGTHDFSSFRTVACQAKHPVRTVHRLDVTRQGDFIIVDVVANAFLHHMVRNVAGTLVAVGRGDQEPKWVKEVLAARSRTAAGITAPADGLYLVGVDYPDTFPVPPVEDRGFPF
jgi:tRNA pseudouridine38-40 synthase